MRVFVTGASGFIGSAVVAELRGAGHEVTGLARSPAAAGRLSALGADVTRATLADTGSLRAAAAACDGVIHLAYQHGEPPDRAAAADRQVIEVLGDALAGSGKPLVVTSGTLVLPAGRAGNESDTPGPEAPAAARAGAERVALALAGRVVRVSVVRLAPCVHERVRRGFAGALVDAAVRSGYAGYLGDGSQRWPALHRQDAASLYRLAVERAPAGAVLHGVGEQGVRLRDIAELIAARLSLPLRQVPTDGAVAYFGWLAALAGIDAPASNDITRSLLGWEPGHPGLLDDLARGDFF
ncbi:MAG TPA: SDR family oxidoreductase [Trebonia sp.]|nr:SDR family oxidoreductase [Trebonia sp.]